MHFYLKSFKCRLSPIELRIFTCLLIIVLIEAYLTYVHENYVRYYFPLFSHIFTARS